MKAMKKRKRLIRISYTKNPHQKEFDQDLTSKYLHLSGGMGSGKSYALVQKMLKLSSLNQLPGGILCPSRPEYKRDCEPIFEDILDKANVRHRCHYNKTDLTWRFPWSKAPLYIFTAERRIRGPNLAFAGINEASLIPWERYKEMVGRVRLKESRYPQILSVGTPEGRSNYTYEIFIEKPMQRSRIIYGSTLDNRSNLADDYIPSLEESFDEVMLKAYLKGLYINMNGNSFYYAFDPDKQYDREIKEDKDLPVIVLLDFNVDPMCGTLCQKRGELTVGFDQLELKERDRHGASSLTDAYCLALKSRGYTPERTTIYPDPAGKARATQGDPNITILEKHGYSVRYKNVAPNFQQRQLATNNVLSKGLFKFHPDKCQGIRKDLEGVEQNPIDYSKIKDNPKLTHYSDGFDYYVDIEYPLSGIKPNSKLVKIR
jgi:hypothetical protein